MKRTLYCLCLSLVVLLLGCKSATTPSVPVKPSMPSPTNNATGVDHSTVLSWSYPAASTDTTVKYTLYLDTINPPVKNVAGNFTAQSYSAANLANQKTYYWQVNVAKSGTIVTGDVWTFTTVNDPHPASKPSVPTPPNASVDQYTNNLNLAWYSISGNAGAVLQYDVYLDTINPPVHKITNSTTRSDTTVNGLASHKLYYWQVVVSDGIAKVTGDVWTFTTYYCMTYQAMKSIPAGSFHMGDQNNVNGGDALPVHTVSISAFFMDSTDVTQGDYGSLMGKNPAQSSLSAGILNPALSITWYDAALYCNERSKRDGLDTVYSYTAFQGTHRAGCTGLDGLAIDYTKHGYRLPTEAEWEYACRGTAGATTDFYWGRNYPPSNAADSAALFAHLKFAGFAGPQPSYKVGILQPNDRGLYDMVGNAYQWCNDIYDAGYYAVSSATDPTGPTTPGLRVVRSLGAVYDPQGERLITPYRYNADPAVPDPTISFRCIRR